MGETPPRFVDIATNISRLFVVSTENKPMFTKKIDENLGNRYN